MRAGRQPVSRAERTPTGAGLEPSPVNVRVKIAALWTSMLFVFAYVDLFSLYRPDIRADVEAGEVGGFAVNQTFLLATTAYVVIPSLMVFCVLVLRPRLNRIVNIAPWPWCTRSASSPQPSASGLTTSWAASLRQPCSRPSSSTHGPGRRRSARPHESTKALVDLGNTAGSPWAYPSDVTHRFSSLRRGTVRLDKRPAARSASADQGHPVRMRHSDAGCIRGFGTRGEQPGDIAMGGHVQAVCDGGSGMDRLGVAVASQWPSAHVRLFAEWLRQHPSDRDAYARIKHGLVSAGVGQPLHGRRVRVRAGRRQPRQDGARPRTGQWPAWKPTSSPSRVVTRAA
jgi:hypothetical protein